MSRNNKKKSPIEPTTTGKPDEKVQNNKSTNNRNRRNNRNRGNSTPKTFEGEQITNKGMNDIAWYTKNPELVASAANVPFPYVPGMKVPLSSTTGDHTNGIFNNSKSHRPFVQVPGIMAVEFSFGIGNSSNAQSPASIAAKELWGRIRSKFSGALEADAPDILMYCLALDSIYSMLSYAKRTYRIAQSYKAYNRLLPERLWMANGPFLPADLQAVRSDLPKYWGRINELIHKAAKFAVVKDLPLYERHKWMCEHVYKDSDDDKAQLYMFTPKGFWVMEPNTASLGYVRNAAISFNAFLDRIDSALEELSGWDDAYTIHGYMLRAFENKEWYTMALLQQDEIIEPVYNPEVLLEIENSHAVGDVTSMDVTQNPATNSIIFEPKTTYSIGTWPSFYTGKPHINSHVIKPDGNSVIIATALACYPDVENGSFETGEFPVLHRSEIVHSYAVYGSEYSGIYAPDLVVGNATSGSSVALLIYMASNYHCAPIGVLGMTSESEGVPDVGSWFFVGGLENITTITHSQLDEINRACLYSLFNCFVK